MFLSAGPTGMGEVSAKLALGLQLPLHWRLLVHLPGDSIPLLVFWSCEILCASVNGPFGKILCRILRKSEINEEK